MVIFFTLPASLLVAFGMLDNATRYSFTPFDPSIFLSLLLAMTNDFALFILTRYKEELCAHPNDNLRAVKVVMSSSGKVVLLSGIILGASFAGLTLITFPLLQGVGLGGAVTIAT